MRLEELQMENEYQLRLKDMNYNEKMKELSETFTQQIESLETMQQVCSTSNLLNTGGVTGQSTLITPLLSNGMFLNHHGSQSR